MKQTLKYILDKQIENLKFSESKHNISITLASGVIVFAVTFIYQNILVVSLLACATVIFCLISILYSFVALSARTVKFKDKKNKTNISNLLFYKHIAKYDEQSYTKMIKKEYGFPSTYKIDKFDYDLAKQVIATARITNKKFSFFNLAIVFLFVGILCLVLAICFVGVYGI